MRSMQCNVEFGYKLSIVQGVIYVASARTAQETPLPTVSPSRITGFLDFPDSFIT
jgi:hypothetical protein